MSRYGNYKPEWAENMQTENKGQNSRFKAFLEKVAQCIGCGRKRINMAVCVALLGGILLFSLDGCKPKQIIVEKEKLVYVTKDSIVHKDSTVYVPVEVYKDYSLDTLVLKTSLAISKSWIDTSNAYLVGEIRNLKAIETKYIEVEKWHTKDSIVQVEKPVLYPVVEEKRYIPTIAWICIVWTLITLISIGIAVYKRLKH